MIKTSDTPSCEACNIENPQLYRIFQKQYLLQTGNITSPNWSEAEVVQWLDLESENKYYYGNMDKNYR